MQLPSVREEIPGTQGIRREGELREVSCRRAKRREKEEPKSSCLEHSRVSAHCQHHSRSAPHAMDIIFGKNKKEQLEPVRAKVTGERLYR